MKNKQKIGFDRLSMVNRWRNKNWRRNSDWVIIGIQKWWAGPEDFCYKLCFFGLDLQVWFKRTFY